MPTELFPDNVLRGLDCFNREAFFEAHELLESVWRDADASVKPLYQGLIQLAAACHHLQHKNLKGADSLLSKSLGWLSPYQNTDTGLDLAALLGEMNQLKATVERLRQHSSSSYEMPAFPRINFLQDPD